MKVTILDATEHPIALIAQVAGVSHGKDDDRAERVKRCIAKGHLSVLEFADVTVRIEGISRACSHQLVRHRLCSFVELSQRYCSIDTDGDWYVIPEPEESGAFKYRQAMEAAAMYYVSLLADGVPPEDARLVLPQATRTAIVMKCNLRELWHIVCERMTPFAQWEIREVVREIVDRLEADPEWRQLLDWLFSSLEVG